LGLVPASKLKEMLRRLEREPLAGKVLRAPLAGCRSVRVAGESRLVYRLLDEGELVEVLAIGRRRESEAYEVAGRRL
jgi:mRNA-degrading endonuclease RelE of RelBE toxin-antitoxin system